MVIDITAMEMITKIVKEEYPRQKPRESTVYWFFPVVLRIHLLVW